MTDMDRLSAALADRYAIEREIGAGGMATVYLARDQKHDRQVAVKVLRPELAAVVGAERFLHEIQIAAKLNHPHILTLIDSGEAHGFLYYVMPYVQGESLRDKLQREKQLSVEEALAITQDVAGAMAYAHAQGVIHRDLKPGNILLHEGEAMVADFGLALALRAAGGQRLTETGLSLGTPEYMSPEQATADHDVDDRSDIYSLGAVLYELLAGEPPHTGRSTQAIIAKLLTERPTPLRILRNTVPEAVDRTVMKALAKTPADRYATVAQFAEALTEASTKAPGVSLGTGREERVRRLVPTALLAALVVGGGWWALSRLGPASAQVDSLVVLPLDNLSGDPEQEWFVEGMHDAIISELAGIGSLRVISRTSAMRYQDTDKSVPQIARELDVAAVLEASVLLVGDSVRIQAQLIQAFPEERHLGAWSYDRHLRDVLAVHSELARAIAEEIKVTLTPGEEARLAVERPVDPEAFRLWLKGNFHLTRLNEQSFRRALESYQEAVAIDPGYAPAYAGIAMAYLQLGGWHASMPPQQLFRRAKEAAERALALDSTLAEAHIVLARIRQLFEWDWGGAERAFRRGIEFDPSTTLSRILYANFLTSMGRFEESIELGRRTLELDPVSPEVYNELAWAFWRAGRDEEALELYEEGLEIDPDFPQSHGLLADFYLKRGESDKAMEHLAEVAGILERASPANLGTVGYLYAAAGRRAEALDILSQLMELRKSAYVPASALADIYLGLGDQQEALRWLERAYEERDVSLVWLNVFWRYDPLRSDPRFQAILRGMDFPD